MNFTQSFKLAIKSLLLSKMRALLTMLGIIIGVAAVILADEPTGALDSRTGREVLELLQSLHAAGNTVVLITHDNSIAVQAQRIIRLEDGHVVYDGPADAPEAVVTPRAAGAAKGGAGA